MKKIITLFAAVALGAALIGCGSKPADDAAAPAAGTTAAAPATTAAAPAADSK